MKKISNSNLVDRRKKCEGQQRQCNLELNKILKLMKKIPQLVCQALTSLPSLSWVSIICLQLPTQHLPLDRQYDHILSFLKANVSLYSLPPWVTSPSVTQTKKHLCLSLSFNSHPSIKSVQKTLIHSCLVQCSHFPIIPLFSFLPSTERTPITLPKVDKLIRQAQHSFHCHMDLLLKPLQNNITPTLRKL